MAGEFREFWQIPPGISGGLIRPQPVDQSTPVRKISLVSSVVTLCEELVANFQNLFDLEDSSFFTEVVPMSQQRHNNLEPLASPLYSPISFSLSNSLPRAVPLPLSPQDIPLPLSSLTLPLRLITFNSQNHSSMAAPIIIMPARGERAAPLFDKSRPREIARFFNDLKILFSQAQIAADSDKKFIIYYTDFETEQIWKSFADFSAATSTYQNFKDVILEYYPDAAGDYVYSMRDVDMLISERQRLGINSTNDLTDFHLHFLAITTWLINKGQLSNLEQKQSYLRAFQPSLLAAVTSQLQTLYPQQHLNKLHTIKEVFDAAIHMLQCASVSQQYVTSAPAILPITILQRPSVPIAALATPAPSIKTENLGALFSEFTKTIIEAMNKNLRGSTSNPQSSSALYSQKTCIMCGLLHLISQCGIVNECYNFLSLFLFSHHCSITPFHFPFELSFISHA